MMTRRFSLRMFSIPILLVTLAGLGWSAPSWAIGLQDAKAQGLLGEQPNGYLGLVQANASGEVKSLMADINSRRRQAYQSIAQRNHTQLHVVESMAGKKAIQRTPPGQYIRLPSGQWTRK